MALHRTTLAALALAAVVAAQSQPLPCQRWAHQTTVASNASTLWIYGGQAKTSPDQTASTWTNALLALDLSKPWNAGAPALTLVQPDSGNPYSPPAVSLGALWASTDGATLYQWGGHFSDTPYVAPGAMDVVQYAVASGQWSKAQTTGDTVLRVSEGAGAVAPNIGPNGASAAFYFSGHEDWASVEGWSRSTPRLFLDSMVELDLSSLQWTNHTSYGTNAVTSETSTSEPAPTIRADGTLTFVPNLGTNGKGVLVAIGGGQNFVSNEQNTNRSIDNSALDVFDIGANSWTKQATSGQIPSPRVNHCSVRGSALISKQQQHQIYVWGGQVINGSAQSTDLYILSIPSFTWTFVGNDLPSQPTGRAGHTCDLIGSQLIVVGGYISSDLLCDSQSVYVLETNSLQWQTKFTPNTLYKTPNLLKASIGGIGTSYSTSGSGYSMGGTNVELGFSNQSNNGGGGGSGGGRKKSSSTGAIVGGILGGLVALLLILLLFLMWRKRQHNKKRQEEEEVSKVKRESQRQSEMSMTNGVNGNRMIWSNESTTNAGGGNGNGNGSGSDETSTAYDRRYQYYPAASDDPEGETANLEAQFSTRLAPKQQLRVVNADE